jgi:protein tyrosine/serine phosphatase
MLVRKFNKIMILTIIKLTNSLAGGFARFPRIFWHLALLISTALFPIGHRAEAKTAATEDLPNYHVVHPYLLRGGQPTTKGLQELRDSGVTTIIDLRAPSERTFDESREALKLGMRYLNLPMSSQAPTKEQVAQFESIVSQAEKNLIKAGNTGNATVTEKPGEKFPGSVFLHCAHGSDRTGCMVGIWRVTHDGWTYDKAYKEMRQYWFNPKFENLSGAVRERAKE